MFEKRCLVFPINRGLHWSLAVVVFDLGALAEATRKRVPRGKAAASSENGASFLGNASLLSKASHLGEDDDDDDATECSEDAGNGHGTKNGTGTANDAALKCCRKLRRAGGLVNGNSTL